MHRRDVSTCKGSRATRFATCVKNNWLLHTSSGSHCVYVNILRASQQSSLVDRGHADQAYHRALDDCRTCAQQFTVLSRSIYQNLIAFFKKCNDRNMCGDRARQPEGDDFMVWSSIWSNY